MNSKQSNKTIKNDQRSEADIQSEILAFSKIPLNQELPISQKSDVIKKLLNDNQVIIIAGETGCGKTTQLPQICLQAGLGVRKQIAHTQPRRVAATSVASRIASELKTELGHTVGYAVRFSDKTSSNTRVKLMTDGVLLAELQSDPLLSRYEVIIVDEAHERSLNIDFLLGFLKQLIKKRSDLKVIVTSATIDLESFSRYFSNAPVLTVEGRTFPVEVVYQPLAVNELSESSKNKSGTDMSGISIEEAVVNAIDYCIAQSTGDILIFSHGEAEIRQLSKHIQKQNYAQIIVLPLYARLGIKEQQAIFSSSNKRKIIISTNVAETSLTIPNILFVIDIGQARVSRYSQRNKIQQLPVEKISQASANQRKGRSGRIAPGLCIRLYDESDFNHRPEFTEPEIKRTNLSSVVLRLKSLGVKDVESFPFIQPPNERQWKVAFNLLFELSAMTDTKEITPMGRRMSKLPLDPQLARILLNRDTSALEEMLIVTSFLGVRDVRIRPPKESAKGAQQKADLCHQVYQDKKSDVVSVINLWRFLAQQKESMSHSKFRRWCQEHFINFVGWLEWKNVYFQVKDELKKVTKQHKETKQKNRQSSKNRSTNNSIETEKVSANDEQIHQALIPGFISHLLMKTPEGHYLGARGLKVWLHPSSVLFKNKAPWILSTEMVETNKLYARANVPVKPEWFEEAATHLLKNNYQDIHWRKNKGHVSAYLNQSLFGLPIVHKRLIDYGKVDKVTARALFLKDGLVENEINMRFPFLDSNQKLIDEIKLEQEKLRRNDLLIDSTNFSQLYEHVIPENIVSCYQLKRWLKKDWRQRNEQLSFEKKQLILNQTEQLEDYPSEILVKGVVLTVSYRFAPGQKEDGVHVSIPAQMLSQFSERDFEWLVPGFLKDKIVATLKNLPKPLRKQLIPISQTADACLTYITSIEYQKKDFKVILREAILRVKSIDIPEQSIDTDDLPVHLKMKFTGLNIKQEKGLNQSSSYYSTLAEAQKSVSMNSQMGRSKKRTERAKGDHLSISENKLSKWPQQKFSIETSFISGQQQVRLFNALADKKTYVTKEQCASLASAKATHIQGVARLILLDNNNLIKEFKNAWPDRRELEKLSLRFGGLSVLIDWIASAQITQRLKDLPSIETAEAFHRVSSTIRKQLREMIASQLTEASICLKGYQKVHVALGHLNSQVYDSSREDIQLQLKLLWQESSFIEKGNTIFQELTRYQNAIESRIKRIQENFPREAKLMEGWVEWLEWWQDFDQSTLNFEAQQKLDQLFWLLEEYRISLFAVNIKTNGKISAKKLQKAFESLELAIQ